MIVITHNSANGFFKKTFSKKSFWKVDRDVCYGAIHSDFLFNNFQMPHSAQPL